LVSPLPTQGAAQALGATRAVTGYGQREDRLRASAAGFEAHFTKPVDLAALDALLQRHRAV